MTTPSECRELADKIDNDRDGIYGDDLEAMQVALRQFASLQDHARRGITETVVLLACEAYRTEAMKPVVRGVDCMRAALEAIAPHLALTKRGET